ncbi:MAG: hypothetical protein HYX97_04215 [Chloroflexi bacterium]|nr:hypothetical protein [Chloroflexota bacterium]
MGGGLFSLTRRMAVPALAVGTVFVALGAIAYLQTSAAGGEPAGETGLPDYVQAADQNVIALYRYAVEHPEVLQGVPCYCGCAALGHRHTRDCFVRSVSPTGGVSYEPMGSF